METGNEDLERLIFETVDEAAQSVKQMREIEGKLLKMILKHN